MLVNIICIQKVDFTNTEGNHIQGVNFYTLDPPCRTNTLIGQKPVKKFIDLEKAKRFNLDDVGEYEVTISISGQIVNMEKVK